MKKFLFIIFLISLQGCVAVVKETVPVISNKPRALTNLSQVRLGMTYKEVSDLMGDEVTVGFKEKENLPGDFAPITVKNPHRTEVITLGIKTYDVLYYFTQVQKPDGIIADDELTPLTFESGRLVGIGHDFLFKIKNQIKI